MNDSFQIVSIYIYVCGEHDNTIIVTVCVLNIHKTKQKQNKTRKKKKKTRFFFKIKNNNVVTRTANCSGKLNFNRSSRKLAGMNHEIYIHVSKYYKRLHILER